MDTITVDLARAYNPDWSFSRSCFSRLSSDQVQYHQNSLILYDIFEYLNSAKVGIYSDSDTHKKLDELKLTKAQVIRTECQNPKIQARIKKRIEAILAGNKSPESAFYIPKNTSRLRFYRSLKDLQKLLKKIRVTSSQNRDIFYEKYLSLRPRWTADVKVLRRAIEASPAELLSPELNTFKGEWIRYCHARSQLVLNFVRLAARFSFRQRGQIYEADDVFQELMISLTRAADAYFTGFGAKFSTFAFDCVRNASVIRGYRWRLRSGYHRKSSAYSIFGESREGFPCYLADVIPNHSALDAVENSVQVKFIGHIVRDGLKCLLPRTRRFIELYYGLNDNTQLTFEEIGRRNHISMERVRQIIGKGLSRMRKQFDLMQIEI